MPKTDDQDTSDVVSTLLRTLEGGGNEEKAEGLMRLAMTLDECSGAEGAQLGAAMRAAGGIASIAAPLARRSAPAASCGRARRWREARSSWRLDGSATLRAGSPSLAVRTADS